MATPVEQIKEVWQRLTMRQRMSLGGAAVATLGLIGAMVYFSSQTEYGVLFSDLRPNDAQNIIEKLKTANVPYQLAGNGTMINVPTDKISELRVQMAADGSLSGGHVGFDLFDKNSFGATDFAQKVNYQRALEGELASTLEGMDEIASARVHITPAKESIFTEKAEPAKASVVLRVKQSRELSRNRTEAITNLVASAVEGLQTTDVKVMDTQGRVLSAPVRDKKAEDAEALGAHLEVRKKFESDMAERLTAMLEPVVGAGRVKAEVTADLDFSQIEQTAEKYDPKSAVIRNQQLSQESRNGKGALNGGVVGARANDPTTTPPPTTPPTTPPAAGNAPANAQASPTPLVGDARSASNTNWEIDKTLTRTLDGGGRLQRLSVSVVVDNQIVNGKPQPRPAEELKKLQDIVTAAAGINTQRGDQVVVQSISFEPAPADAGPSFIERYRDLMPNAIKYGAFLAIALALVFLVIRPATSTLQAALAPPPEQKLLPAATDAEGGEAGEQKALEGEEAAALEGKEPAQLNAPMTVADAISEEELAAMPEEERKQLEERVMEDAIDIPAPITIAELEAQIAKEMESHKPEVKRTVAIKNQLVETGMRDPEALARSIRNWLEEKNPKA